MISSAAAELHHTPCNDALPPWRLYALCAVLGGVFVAANVWFILSLARRVDAIVGRFAAGGPGAFVDLVERSVVVGGGGEGEEGGGLRAVVAGWEEEHRNRVDGGAGENINDGKARESRKEGPKTVPGCNSTPKLKRSGDSKQMEDRRFMTPVKKETPLRLGSPRLKSGIPLSVARPRAGKEVVGKLHGRPAATSKVAVTVRLD